MPDIIFRNVIIIDDHNITDHGFIVVYAKWLALIAVNISLGKGTDGGWKQTVSDFLLLPGRMPAGNWIHKIQRKQRLFRVGLTNPDFQCIS